MYTNFKYTRPAYGRKLIYIRIDFPSLKNVIYEWLKKYIFKK